VIDKPEPVFSDADAAALYDTQYPWDDARPTHVFYNSLVMAAGAVLDVGCGTGSMLHWARDHGHRGRLVGLDPDPAMLGRARRRDDVEWVRASAAEAQWDQEFDLAIMSGNAFQCLVTDEELRTSLAAVHRALRDGGRFAFETRHPQDRAWETWNPDNADEVDFDGRRLLVVHHVESVSGGLVTFTETTADPDGTPLRVDRATLRFVTPSELDGFLAEAGFTVEARYGDWHRNPIDATSREIITVARRGS
jgi:SAM-dependent methyltransferase